MSKDLISMGSKSKPSVLIEGEYPQWRMRMIRFLNNIDKKHMKSIKEGPIESFVTIHAQPSTATTQGIPTRKILKSPGFFNEVEQPRA